MHWILPLLIGIGMAIGALLGMALTSDAALQEGPAGDLAGAFGALTVMMCLLVGLLVSTVTLAVRALLKRPAPRRLLARLAVSIAGGMLIGALGSTSLLRDTLLPWLPLLVVPAVTCWPWRGD
ncbi:MAG: hypothetical protein ABMA15_01635 [Vicinamibacterales bacterium]